MQKNILNLFLLSNLFLVTPAHAYLDPGTFSIIISAIVSFFAAALFYIKNIIYFIKRRIGKMKNLMKRNKTN